MIEQLECQSILAVVPLTNKLSTWHKLISEKLPQYHIAMDADSYKKLPAPRLLLVHYEQLPSIIKRVAKWSWDLVILDEAQRIKARASRQSRNLRMLRNATRRLALSGTPMDDSEIDLWGIMRFIEPRALSDNWSTFDQTFLRPTGFMGYGREMRDDMKQAFNDRIKPFCLRVTRQEASIEEPVMHWCPVSLLGGQARVYEQLERGWIVDIERKRIKTELEITKRVKLQQIANGFIYDEDGTFYEVGGAKLRKLNHLLKRRITPPAIIFFQYMPEAELIEEVCLRYSDKVEVLVGSVKDKKLKKPRTEMIQRFQRGEIDYLLCQQKTGGVGIDLYKARNAIFYSFNHSYIDFDQAKSRMDFPGMPAPSIFLIIAEVAIDEAKRDAVLFKRSFTESILAQFQRRSEMAKETTKSAASKGAAAKPAEAVKKSNLPPRPEYKYNITSLADVLDIEPASVRIKLRKLKIKKAEGGIYGWNTKADFDEVVKQLRGDNKAAGDKKKAA